MGEVRTTIANQHQPEKRIDRTLLSKCSTLLKAVCPLYQKKSTHTKPIVKLTPELEVESRKLSLMTPQLAGISMKDLREPVGNIKQSRPEILAALDLLITGF